MSPGRTRSPRVSILLPARNASATLDSCLRSVRRQALGEWECVLVDNGSSDGTRQAADRFAARDGRFRVVPFPEGNLVAALNEGVRHCRAPLIARMDADDLMHRDRLAAQAQALERESSLAAVGCHVRLFPRAALARGLRDYEAWLNSLRSCGEVARDAFVECPVAHPSLMMRRDMAALGYADRGWPEDYDLVLRALGARMRIGVVPRRLLSWRDGPRRLSRTDPRYALDRFLACKAHYLAAGFLGGSDRYILCGYGSTGSALRRALARLDRHPAWIVEVHPARLGKRIHGAPVIPAAALPGIEPLPILVSVARQGPRSEVRRTLAALGFVEGKDYVCAA